MLWSTSSTLRNPGTRPFCRLAFRRLACLGGLVGGRLSGRIVAPLMRPRRLKHNDWSMARSCANYFGRKLVFCRFDHI